MKEQVIICKPTLDTYVRLLVVLVAFVGFGLYFFYDGSIGYPKANQVYLSYKAFADLGDKASGLPAAEADASAQEQWAAARAETPLFAAEVSDNRQVYARIEADIIPLPQEAAAVACPPETLDLAAMQQGWSSCWEAYSKRMGFPIKPADHPYTTSSTMEQHIAGSLSCLVGLGILIAMVRLSRRRITLNGDRLSVGGHDFPVTDIELIDLRQWGVGFKGVAYITVGGKRLRIDGMTYGGFDKKKGEPAEALMQALLAMYKGNIMEYEQTQKETHH